MLVQVNGIQLFVETVRSEDENSGHPLIMLHGNGEDHTIFLEAAEILKDSFTCYLVDSRGHGQSTQVSELHYADMAADMISLLETMDLRDVVFYGFSDGGIVGLLTAMQCDRIRTLIISGANLTPRGVKPCLRYLFQGIHFFNRDPKLRLMLKEPQITKEDLGRITARTLVLAGSRDVIQEKETRRIAEGIPGAELQILPGETHGSYIVHQKKIGEIIRAFADA